MKRASSALGVLVLLGLLVVLHMKEETPILAPAQASTSALSSPVVAVAVEQQHYQNNEQEQAPSSVLSQISSSSKNETIQNKDRNQIIRAKEVEAADASEKTLSSIVSDTERTSLIASSLDKEHQLSAQKTTAVSSNYTSRTLEDFLESHIDFSKGGNCGGYKCFFHSKIDPSLGYLIMQNKRDKEWCDKRDLNAIHQGWDWSLHLSHDFGVPHLLVQPPFVVQAMNRTSVIQLNQFISQQFSVTTFEGKRHDHHFVFPEMLTKHKRSTKCFEFYIQPVTKSSPDSVMFKCVKGGNHWQQGLEKRELLVQETIASIQRHQQQTTPSFDFDTFEQRMRNGTAAVIEATVQHRWLHHDYQMFIEPSGKIFSLDLDRCCKCQMQSRYKNHTLDPDPRYHNTSLEMDIDKKQRERIEKNLRKVRKCFDTTWTFINETIDMVREGILRGGNNDTSYLP